MRNRKEIEKELSDIEKNLMFPEGRNGKMDLVIEILLDIRHNQDIIIEMMKNEEKERKKFKVRKH